MKASRNLICALAISVPGVLNASGAIASSDPPCVVQPQGHLSMERDFDGDGHIDQLRLREGGGASLYRACDTGGYAEIIRSTTGLEPTETGEGPAFRVSWTGDDRAAWIDGHLFRFRMLPMVSAAPVDVEIRHRSHGWTAALPRCELLHVNAPLYRFAPDAWTLEVEERTYALHPREQEEYDFGALEPVMINADRIMDGLLPYEERFGSGREAYAAVLLGCGNGSYVVSGVVPAGRVGGTVAVRRLHGAPVVVATDRQSGKVTAFRINPQTLGLTRIAQARNLKDLQLRFKRGF